MKKYLWILLLPLLMSGCKGQKKISLYDQIYKERPATIYIAPLDDRSERRPMRTLDDSIYNASLNIATKQLYLTAADPLVFNGYYVLGPLASAQLAASETRTGKQLRNDNITDYQSSLGIDAILFITLLNWSETQLSWSAEIEYTLRSTHSGNEIMHVTVHASKQLQADFKGDPRPLPPDQEFAQKYNCDLPTAQRCRLVELTNQFILKDLPSGRRSRSSVLEPYVSSLPEFFNLNINPSGGVELLKSNEN